MTGADEIWAYPGLPDNPGSAQIAGGGHPVVYVGAGPGAPDLITRRGRDRLVSADVVVADRPSLDDLIDRYARVGAERVLVGRTRSQAAWSNEAVAHLVADRHAAGHRVVRLKSGDLFVCSRAAEELAALRLRSVPVELVPGVSAAVAAPLAAGLPLIPGGKGVATVLAGNDDPVYPPVDWAGLAGAGGTLVVLMGRAHQRAIADRLVAEGRDPATTVHLVHAATRGHQQTVTTTLAGLGEVRLPAPATAVIAAPEPDRAHP